MNTTLELRIDIWRCVHILRKKWRLIALISAAAFLASFACTWQDAGDVFSATATVYSTAEGGASLTQLQETTSAMQRYAEVANSLKVLGRAADLMGDPQISGRTLSRMVRVTYKKDSSILSVRATSSSPAVAVSAANAVAAAFVSEITAITGQNNTQVLDVAADYIMESNSARTRWLMRFLATALAVLATCGVILLRDILSSKIHSPMSASLGGELEILGFIPDFSMMQGGSLPDDAEKSVPHQ